MATAGEDTTANAPSAAYEGGGAGGKFRKRPFRRAQATPYDRPPTTALRNPSWLSKLVVDPASKLINAGARRLFASFSRKTLPPPPSHPPLPAIPAPPPSGFSSSISLFPLLSVYVFTPIPLCIYACVTVWVGDLFVVCSLLIVWEKELSSLPFSSLLYCKCQYVYNWAQKVGIEFRSSLLFLLCVQLAWIQLKCLFFYG